MNEITNAKPDEKDIDDFIENIDEINFKKSITKFIRKKSISQYNIKNIITFILNEYTGYSLLDIVLNILSLKKGNPVCHLLSMIYNCYVIPTKSLASALLFCFSLSEI